MSDYNGAARSGIETRMTQEGQMNAGGIRRIDDTGKPYYDQAPITEYPRMLYRKTEVEQIEPAAEAIPGLKDAPKVINRFGDLLCDMCIANSATEAEALAELGWDVSPRAAYGLSDGLVAATSAKDERIAELERQLAERGVEKRGPGRPPKLDVAPSLP